MAIVGTNEYETRTFISLNIELNALKIFSCGQKSPFLPFEMKPLCKGKFETIVSIKLNCIEKASKTLSYRQKYKLLMIWTPVNLLPFLLFCCWLFSFGEKCEELDCFIK